ncbi:MAG: hypothetical protein JO166_17200 [Deltaproteobacteria bacterium]|nr:hypothetical protein [Deltaproteobacteria bacterium]
MAISEAGREELFGRVATSNMGLTADQTVGGLALIVLSILALVGVYPALLTSIDTIVAGVAVVFISLALNREFTNALSISGRGLIANEAGGVGAVAVAGIAGIVLGILAILDVARPTLTAVALMVFGAAVFLHFIMGTQTRALRMTGAAAPSGSSKAALSAAAGTEMASVLFAIALVVLGILALTGVRSEILIAVAFLSFGGYMFLKGTETVGHMFWWGRSAMEVR